MMIRRSRSRSLLYWLFILLQRTTPSHSAHEQQQQQQQRTTTTTNFLKHHLSSVRTLPTALLKNSIPVASFRKRRRQRHVPNDNSNNNNNKANNTHEDRKGVVALVSSIKSKIRTTGYFYGLQENMMVTNGRQQQQQQQQQQQTNKPEKESMDVLMNHALDELRGMRQEMTALRKDLKTMKQHLGQEEDNIDHDDGDADGDDTKHKFDRPTSLLARIQKQREWDKVGLEIEQWAEKLLFEEHNDEQDSDHDNEHGGWKEVKCSKLCKQYNKDGNIRCYLKYMVDSRGDHATEEDEQEYPCIKLFATLDAPMEQVCDYLADESSVPDYNDIVVKHQDLEDIAPHSKICWGQSPQILFVKPRDFVTFCHHRWLRDGTQVIVNQACDPDDYEHVINRGATATAAAGDSSSNAANKAALKAFALRGANFISRDPNDPSKTRFSLVAHANPGSDISPWMARLAVKNLVPIEPFKLFHKINKCVQSHPDPSSNQTQLVYASPGRSTRPGGLSQMGYACFWPKGGGLKEGFMHEHHPDQIDPAVDPEEQQQQPLQMDEHHQQQQSLQMDEHHQQQQSLQMDEQQGEEQSATTVIGSGNDEADESFQI